MDIRIAGTEHDVYQYMVNHGHSWISQESMMTSNRFLLSSYLVSQENVREVIKIEEMDPIDGDDGCCSSGPTEDLTNVYTFNRKEYMDYESKTCCLQVPSNTHLWPHGRSHQTEKPYRCGKCDKCFTMKKYLNKHQVIHAGEKAFKCNECGKQFTYNSDLKRHQVIHTGEKALTCDECGKQFSQSFNLKQHQHIHTGEKAFTCDECGKQFSRSGNLKQHKLIHTRGKY